jgi:hypothetical protein
MMKVQFVECNNTTNSCNTFSCLMKIIGEIKSLITLIKANKKQLELICSFCIV